MHRTYRSDIRRRLSLPCSEKYNLSVPTGILAIISTPEKYSPLRGGFFIQAPLGIKKARAFDLVKQMRQMWLLQAQDCGAGKIYLSK